MTPPGDLTQGRRRPDDTSPWDLEAGDYAIHESGEVWAKAPDGYGAMNLTTWSPIVHEDGTLTLSPSIFCDPPNGWHGFLRRGVWEEV